MAAQTVFAQTCSSTLEQEYQALMALYQSTNGANWTNKTGWSTADPNTVQSVQGWYGVTTNAEGKVIYLNLNGQNLVGTIPSNIGNLTCLESLSLFSNQLTGSIPSGLWNLANLKELRLNNNQLTGSLPSTIENLDRIERIELHANQLSGALPAELTNLTTLKYLYLHGNPFSGSIPNTLGNLTNLLELSLSGNGLTGSIPSSVGSLSNLQSLSLFSNQLNGNIPATLGNLTNLKQLRLSNNQLTGSIPSSLGNLTSIEHIDLNTNQLTGSIPGKLGKLTALKFLYLYTNQLSGSIPDSLGYMTNIVELLISSNQLTGSIPSRLGSLSKLEVLSLFGNQLSGSIPSELGSLTKLKSLRLNNNQLTGAIPSTIGNLTTLENLELNSNQLSGSIPSTLGNLTNLKYLRLHSNQLTGPIPSTLGGLSNLLDLWLSTNGLTDSIPSSFGGLANVQIISLFSNQLTGRIPAELGTLTKLASLRLSNNQLKGVIPSSIGSAAALKTLEVNSNQLRGAVPMVLTDLNSLQLHSNKFTFSDFLPAKQGFAGSLFTYSTQDSVDVRKTVSSQAGESLTLTTSIDRTSSPASVYQWFKLVNGVSTALNTASASGHTHVISNMSQSDVGTKYYYTITNGDASGLTLRSRNQTFAIMTCTTPTLDFQSAEINGTHTFTPALTGENCTATYAWDFGDGTTSSEQTAVHTYETTGTYNVKLTVSYNCGSCPAGELIKEHQVTIENGLCGSIYCDGIGGVGIGTRKTDGFRLSVNGKIRASDIIKVYPQGQWSDFVFAKDYRLPPLKEVELFINKNGHLPGIPSAKEVENAGIDLGAMDAKLLQKIEELTLYMLEQEKRFHEQELKLAAQQKQIDELKKLLGKKNSK